MPVFLILSATTSALMLLMGALMERRWRLAGRTGRALLGAVILSALLSLPVLWVIRVAEGPMAALIGGIGMLAWHLAGLWLFSRFLSTVSRPAGPRDARKT